MNIINKTKISTAAQQHENTLANANTVDLHVLVIIILYLYCVQLAGVDDGHGYCYWNPAE